MDKVEGKAKEAYGAIIGDEAKKAEGLGGITDKLTGR